MVHTKGLFCPQRCRAVRAESFTMLAPGSGPEQRTRLALQWRQISCEYGGVGWGLGVRVSLA